MDPEEAEALLEYENQVPNAIEHGTSVKFVPKNEPEKTKQNYFTWNNHLVREEGCEDDYDLGTYFKLQDTGTICWNGLLGYSRNKSVSRTPLVPAHRNKSHRVSSELESCTS